MKKLLNILGGCGGGCKKILGMLVATAMVVSVIPVTFAITYQEFEYNGETHYLIPATGLDNLVSAEATFFFRTNPALSGDDDAYLYGYGYGYFQETGYGYGYGFGYGYEYFATNVSEWEPDDDKFGLGLGESYGEYKLPVSGGVTAELPAPMTFAEEDLGAEVILPEGLVMTASDENWDGTLVVTAAADDGNVDGFGDSGVVSVEIDLGDTCEDCTISLDSPVVVMIPNDDFTAGDLVMVSTAEDDYEVDECSEAEYDGGGEELPGSYTLGEDDHCYTYDASNVYVATTNFTVFVAGPAEEDGGGGGGGSVKKKVVKEEVVEEEASDEVSDFTDLLSLKEADWQYSVIQQMLDLGLFQGVTVNGKKVFNMTGSMTRAMAATVICRYMGCDEDAVVTVAPFSDVGLTTWYSAPVAYLKAQGIVEGKAGNKFDPTGTVTRAQFFKMIVKAYMKLHPSIATEWETLMGTNVDYYADVVPANWYYTYMNLAAHKGLLKGVVVGGKRYAKGGQDVTRVQAAAMLSYLLNLQ